MGRSQRRARARPLRGAAVLWAGMTWASVAAPVTPPAAATASSAPTAMATKSVPAEAAMGVANASLAPRAGVVCTVADGWWSLDKDRPVQPEPVTVVLLQPMIDGSPGAWVKPMRGPLTEHQYQIALARVQGCR